MFQHNKLNNELTFIQKVKNLDFILLFCLIILSIVSVLVEHGGSGSSAAAPVAKKVIKKIIERHETRELVNYKKLGENI